MRHSVSFESSRARAWFPFLKGDRHDPVTATDAGGHATAWVCPRDPERLCPFRGGAGRVLSSIPRSTDRRAGPAVLSAPDQPEADQRRNPEDLPWRDPVLLRRHAPAAHAAVGPGGPQTAAEAAGGAQHRG